MLKPKLKIGLVYGHKLNLLSTAENIIESMKKQGYRVESSVINTTSLRRENDNIFQAIVDKFADINAAIVFMTPDDRAISVKDLSKLLKKNKDLSANALATELSLRSRQNVIYELGYVTGIVGEHKYRIFCPGNIEIPSDIQGKYTERDLSPDNVEKVIHDFIENNLSCFKQVPTLNDTSYITDYSNVTNNPSDSLKEFDTELEQLESVGNKIFYLFERIVFDSYFQQPDWWLTNILPLLPSNPVEESCKKILLAVLSYMGAWMPHPEENENHRDFDNIYIAKNRLQKHLSIIEDHDVNPIILMVGYDYLGLCYNKLGRNIDYDQSERNIFLEKSKEYLTKTINLASKHDDPLLPLWKGFAQFNLARTLHEISKIDNTDSNNEWRHIFHDAIETRKLWIIYKNKNNKLPYIVNEGIETEFYHAIAERLIRVKYDDMGLPEESGHFKISKEKLEKYKHEYDEWLKAPNQNKVRLANNVRGNWENIDKKLKEKS